MLTRSLVPVPRWTRREMIRRGVLRVVSERSQEDCELLSQVTVHEWRELLHWLDVSGMALYFFDQLREMGHSMLLPDYVRQRLEQNLADNTIRTQGMIDEAADIRDAFSGAGLRFALLKGLSLSPDSVMRPELRSQLDIDFLLMPKEMEAAAKILENRGYYQHAASKRSREFKTYAVPSGSLADLYRHVPWRCVELHAELEDAGGGLRLGRREIRTFSTPAGSIEMPVLWAPDIFIGQGLHLFKHVSSAHYRAAHLVEFHRHLVTRHGDNRFWRDVEARASETGASAWGLGVVTLLDALLIAERAPESFASWTVDRLSGPVRLWVERYGWRSALGNIPGNKLYLLLTRKLEEEGNAPRLTIPDKGSVAKNNSQRDAGLASARVRLIPRGLPPMVVQGQAGEPLAARLHRYKLQLRFLMLRLRFHVVEGLRFAWELQQWERSLKDMERLDSSSIPATNKGMTIR